MAFSLVFIGDTHGFIDDFSKQKEIIEEINPEFVLAERLENLSLDSKEKFENILMKKRISNMTSFEDVKKLIQLCFEKNINLIGIDFKNFGFDDNLQKVIINQGKCNKEEEEKLNKIIEKRQKRHLKIIKEYQNKTKKPAVVIVGCWHLRDDSLLMKSLENYKVIFPCDKNGNLLFEPSGDKNISYCEKVK